VPVASLFGMRSINILICRARTALHALSRDQMMELNPPTWYVPQPPSLPTSSVLQEYADYLLHHRGNPAVTVQDPRPRTIACEV
jgi:hypothetical protein